MSQTPCPFCTLPAERIIDSNDLAIVIRDGFPISQGHTLIIPKRHTGSFFDTSDEEKLALFELIERAKLKLDQEFHPDGYNIGVNDALAADQTGSHLQIYQM